MKLWGVWKWYLYMFFIYFFIYLYNPSVWPGECQNDYYFGGVSIHKSHPKSGFLIGLSQDILGWSSIKNFLVLKKNRRVTHVDVENGTWKWMNYQACWFFHIYVGLAQGDYT